MGDLRDLRAAHIRRRRLGWVFAPPIDVVLSPFDVVEPDIVFVAAARRHLIGDRAITGAPDLVMEVLSPSTRRVDLVQKQALYARNGIPEYWIIDPAARSVTVLHLAGDRYQPVPAAADPGATRSVVLPEFAVDAAALFAQLPALSES